MPVGGLTDIQWQTYWDKICTAIEQQEGRQDETINRIRRLASHTVPTTIAHATDNGTSATIVVDPHTRVYADATALAVAGGSQAGLLSDTFYAIYYDDVTLSNQTPTYHFTTDKMEAQTAAAEGRHFLGLIRTPVAGSGLTTDGGGVYAAGSNVGGELD
jgi:hypothetical protein